MAQQLFLFDTNVWVKEHLFRSSVGAAILYGLRAKQYRLLVPDVLRDEVTARVGDAAVRAADRAKSNLAALAAITGSVPSIRLPQSPEISRSISQRWSELEPLTEPFVVTEELMRRALRRVIDHRAPGGEKEQFRDALIWEVALQCSQNVDLHLVSEDKDFGSAGKLLADLNDEAASAKARLTFHSHTDTVLALLVPRLPISVEAVTQAVLSALGWRLAELRAAPVFDIGEVARSEVKAYATENPDRLAVIFEIALAASRKEQSTRGELIVRGECVSDSQSGAVFDVRTEDIVFKTIDEESRIATFLSTEQSRSSHRLTPFRVRREIFDSAGD